MAGFIRGRGPWRLAAGAAVVGAIAAITTAPGSASAHEGHHPKAHKIGHVRTIILENKSYEATFTGLNQNSYLWKTLPSYGELLTQYYGTGHYSLSVPVGRRAGASWSRRYRQASIFRPPGGRWRPRLLLFDSGGESVAVAKPSHQGQDPARRLRE